MKSTGLLAVATSLALVACAPDMPEQNFPNNNEILDRTAQNFSSRAPVEVVRLPGKFFVAQPLTTPIPSRIANRRISLRVPGGMATFSDVVALLEMQGVAVAYPWDAGQDLQELLDRPLTFSRFSGTLGGLVAKLRSTMGVASWYEHGAVFFSPQQQYVVSVPPVDSALTTIASELEELGALEVQASTLSSQIRYVASPGLQDRVISRFLQRAYQNMSEMTMQIALVSLSLNGSEDRGFDWDLFTSTLSKAQEGASDTFSFTLDGNETSSANLIGSSTSLFGLFGTDAALSVTGAINFLSRFGNTTIEQNIEMRTISGSQVDISSTRTIPYIEEVSLSEDTDANTQSQDIEFGELVTGVNVTVSPNFEADTGIVTMNVNIDNTDFIEFLEVEVPGTGGAIQRPITDQQTLSDLVRVPAGQTVIIGGVTSSRISDTRVAPLSIWKAGNSDRTVEREALFIVLRPFVTLYEMEDSKTMLSAARSSRSLENGTDLTRAASPAAVMGSDFSARTAPAAPDRFHKMLDSILTQ